jgi:hypothetical protein
VSNRLDWSQWILQKNNEAKQEELSKSGSFYQYMEPLEKVKWKPYSRHFLVTRGVGPKDNLPFKHGSTVSIHRATGGRNYSIVEHPADGSEPIMHENIPWMKLDNAMHPDVEETQILRQTGEAGTEKSFNKDKFHQATVEHVPIMLFRASGGPMFTHVGNKVTLRGQGEPHTKAGEGTLKGKKSSLFKSDRISNRPDWSQWILQKNNEAKQEELSKSDSIKLEKALPGARNPSKGDPMFEPHHLNEVAKLDHINGKKRAHQIISGANARDITKNKARLMVDRSKNLSHLLNGMSNYMLAHPSENLKVGRGAGRGLPDENDGGAEAA